MVARGKFSWAWPLFIARLLLGGVLFYAGWLKIGDPHGFAKDISHYKLFPKFLERLAAVTLPWNELIIGAMLILNILPRAASLLSTGLFVVFACAVSSALYRGYDISCGCFSPGHASPLGIQTLILDFVCLALSLFILLKSKPAARKSKS